MEPELGTGAKTSVYRLQLQFRLRQKVPAPCGSSSSSKTLSGSSCRQICTESRKPRLFFKQIITKIDTERRIWHNLLNMWGTGGTGCSPSCSLSIFLEDPQNVSMIWIRIRIMIFVWIRIRKKNNNKKIKKLKKKYNADPKHW
jgi:hypothetical protein